LISIGFSDMSKIRNALIAFGAFWLSILFVPWLSFALHFNIIYDSVWFEAIAMGLMLSMGLAFAAGLAGAITTVTVDSTKPERWALIVSILYLFDAPMRYGAWHVAPTTWDHAARAVSRIWPAVACMAVAIIASRIREKKKMQSSSNS
jgi:hypothetical protein